MKLSKPPFFSFIFLLTIGNPAGVHASDAGYNDSKKNGINGFRPTKLFVFGDSYSDTGNYRKLEAFSWKQPYGITFPGKPFGRFSDGRVLPDYIARFLGVESPAPFRWMKYAQRRRLQYGMNFAFGGTGVFDTLIPGLNMTTQIGFLQKLIDDSVYTNTDLHSSMAFFTVCGNDYTAYRFMGGTKEGLPAYTKRVVNQIATNMKRLHNMGVKKVSVSSMQPFGCLPTITAHSSFQQCNDSLNEGAMLHNSMLQKMVARLNSQTPGSPYFILDLYSPFITIIKQKKLRQEGSRRFETPMKPCCVGVSKGYECSSVDKNGVKMYTMCSDPNAAFFWDGSHPTQAGWSAVYDYLKPTLHEHLF
ncbi:PREDICTED: GDSL esterase/lipase At5g03610-like [Ipomoea nil]|uniref:GDSL esterase/lipase At5g03610-like n=1 Tax=Ipomoea nil TaxID=35883 RepID=UPI000901D58F|nr:PREDICTED: GDSL esterase/lipase At5g03610-like [Ipomoea nil]